MTRDVSGIFLFYVNTRPLATSLTHETQRLASYKLRSHLEKAGKSSQGIHVGKGVTCSNEGCVKYERSGVDSHGIRLLSPFPIYAYCISQL